MSLQLLLAVARGGTAFAPPPAWPTTWGVSRFVGNPIIVTSVGEPAEQYDPAPIRLPSGDIWAYVKGAQVIYAYKSTDNGETFVGQNGGNAVINVGAGGTWDDTGAIEPCAVYDAATDTIHLWYKGTSGAANDWAWGHATAPGSNPVSFTKDPSNPILTSSDISTALGGATVADTAPFDVIVSGGTTYFYGYAQYNGRYRIILSTGTDWGDPGAPVNLIIPPNDATIAASGSVFQLPGGSLPRYGMFYTWGPLIGAGRTIRVAQASALAGPWTDMAEVMAPTSGWEVYHVYTPRVLRTSTAPYLAPIVDGFGRWKLYYSGADASWVHSQTGLAYLTPT